MNEDLTMINSRQKELLRTLLFAKKSISYKELAEMFKVSTRTMQREVTSLKTMLNSYDIKIVKRMGLGIEMKGSPERMKVLEENLGQAKTFSTYSPEERWEGITYELLLSKEPFKQFVFSSNYGVTEATISNDLDKVSSWLEKGGIELVRAPGIGVYVKGTEQQRRTMLSSLLHKDISFEEWLELFYTSKQQELLQSQGKLGTVIRNRLLKFVHTPNILAVEKAVHEVLRDEKSIELTDRNYVNLIVHLMLAVERNKQGEVNEQSILIPNSSVDQSMYVIAEKIVVNIENILSISIPKVEIDYIALHLTGALLAKGKSISIEQHEEFDTIELAKSYIHAVEYSLKESFEGDELLLEGLVAHFVPAFKRLKLGLQIHNPMVEKIKEQYPEVFIACQKASYILKEKTGSHIPEGEIGYIAMHIGASIIRKKNLEEKEYQAVVVCASGLGTSTYLASQLRNEIPNLEIEAIIPLSQIQDWIKENGSVDIFISTIDFPPLENENIVTVSPFLRKEDLYRIQNALKNVSKKERFSEKENHQLSMLPLARTGEAMVQILRNVNVIDQVKIEQPMLENLVRNIESSIVCQSSTLLEDIQRREQQGSFVLNNLAMIHAKSDGVNELLVVIFRMEEFIKWRRDDDQEQLINTFLLLVAPKFAPKEHIKMISEISAMLVEEDFIAVLEEAPFNDVKNTLDEVLSKAYVAKAKGSLKEL